jgi:hypothetical protein
MNLDSKTIGELQEVYEKCGQTVQIKQGHVYKDEKEIDKNLRSGDLCKSKSNHLHDNNTVEQEGNYD